MNEPKKICPLLHLQPAEECSDPSCLGQKCAWYIPPDHPSLQPEGRCAVTYLASISYGVRNI